MEVIVIAQMDNTIDHTFESANRVYSIGGVSPTLPTGCGGGHLPKILEKVLTDGNQTDKRLCSKDGQVGARKDVAERIRSTQDSS